MPNIARCNWLNQNGVQCGMPLGHPVGHGNGLLTTPRDTWHEFVGDPPPTLDNLRTVEAEKFGVVWTDKSTRRRCAWSGVNSYCIYEQGHTLPHKEESIHGH